MRKIIYVAEFDKYGESLLAKMTARETAKQYQVERSERVLGYLCVGRRINKGTRPCFDTELDALLWLAERAREYVRKCQVATSKARSRVASLEQMVEEQHKEQPNE